MQPIPQTAPPELPQPTGKTELLEYLRCELAFYSSYHDHKEQMATAVATLYLGGAIAAIVNPLTKGPGFWIIAFVGALTVYYVGWQLRNRRTADLRVTAIERLMGRLLVEDVYPEGLVMKDEDRKRWPLLLVQEIKDIKKNNPWWKSAALLIPLFAMVVTGAAVVYLAK